MINFKNNNTLSTIPMKNTAITKSINYAYGVNNNYLYKIIKNNSIIRKIKSNRRKVQRMESSVAKYNCSNTSIILHLHNIKKNFKNY